MLVAIAAITTLHNPSTKMLSPTPDEMRAAVQSFVRFVQPEDFDLERSVGSFAPNLTWSFPPRGYPRQISREGFVDHMRGGYNGTLAWSSQLRRTHVAGSTLVAQAADFYLMRRGLLCNWPQVYWRAEFDSAGRIEAWTDLIPSDDDNCAGQANASAIEAAITQRWRAFSRGHNASAFATLYSAAAVITVKEGGDGPAGAPPPAGACNRSCAARYGAALLASVEELSARPSGFCINGPRVTYALDLMGYPKGGDGHAALLRRGVAFATTAPQRTGGPAFEIESEDFVFERFLPRPSEVKQTR